MTHLPPASTLFPYTTLFRSAIGDRPLSVEVTTNDHELMLAQGRTIAKWARNIVVKIPVINEDGEPSLGVISALEREGIRVNRSEEHTSALQSLTNLVCRLLL